MHFDTAIDIQAPPDRVWATVQDIEHWHEWTPTVISVRPLDPGPLAVGTRAVVRQPKLLPACWQVTEIEPGRSFTWSTRGPGVLVTARHSIKPVGSHCRVMLSLDFSGIFGSIAGGLTRGLNVRYLALEAQGFKKYVEAGAPSPASKEHRVGESQ